MRIPIESILGLALAAPLAGACGGRAHPADKGEGVYPGATGQPFDGDGDGHASEANGGDDCDDTDPTVYAGAPEDCHGEIDSDCDGVSHLCDMDVTFLGATRTGEWVELLDDLDGDGLAEVLVGGYVMVGPTGGSYIVLSSNLGPSDTINLESIAACQVFGDLDENEDFGQQFIPHQAGDIDGRGRSDLVFGFPYDRANARSRVSLFFGEDFDCSGLLWIGEAQVHLDTGGSQRAGSRLASGDLNGDGRPDLAVGDYAYPDVGSQSGAIYLFDGASLAPGTWDMDALASTVILGEAEEAMLIEGGIVTRDLNGDGLADLATDRRVPRLAVHVFDGADLAASAWLTEADASASIAGTGNGETAWYPREGGDVNGDGYDDLLVRSLGDSIDGIALWHGQSRLLSGSLNASDADVAFVDGPSTDDADGALRIGLEFAGAGDMHGDGLGDILISGSFDSVEGRAFFFEGSSIPASGTVSVSEADASFAVPVEKGTSIRLWGNVAGGKDVNGDDIPDLLIGDPERDVAYLVYGW